MARPKSGTRDRLLTDTMFYVSMHGVGTLNLRDLAGALGTSHRMLIFHFGSKEGLLTEITRVVRDEHRELIHTALAARPDSVVDALRRLWRALTDPSNAPHLRLFLEIYGQAVQGRPYAVGLLDDLTVTWTEPIADVLTGYGRTAARAEQAAGVVTAVIRGLLLSLLATGDRIAADDSFEGFLTTLASENDLGSGALLSDHPHSERPDTQGVS